MLKKREDPLSWLYDIEKKDINSIIKTIVSILSNIGEEFYTLILTSKFDIIDILETLNLKNFTYKKKKLGENIYSFNLTKIIRGSKKARISRFILFKHKTPNIYILITHEKYRNFHYDIISFFDKFYPKISRFFLDSNYLEKILHHLEKNLENSKIQVRHLVKQARIVQEFARREFETEVKFTDRPFEELFQEARENDEWINYIEFTLIKPFEDDRKKYKYSDVKCKISRYAFFRCNKMFGFFYNNIVRDIISKVTSDIKILDNRERTKEENLKTKPVVIKYNINVFKDKKQNKKLIEALQKITYSSTSTYHLNPYLHCSFNDFRDGSSYDIWILSDNEITIVPQMRSTYASLVRLCNFIFIWFREGIIKDFYSQNARSQN